MPAAYQIKDIKAPHYLTFQVVCCLGLLQKNSQGQQLQRITQQYTEGSNTTAKLWAGACEYITENSKQKTLTYLSGPEGVFALHVKKPNGTENIRYIHKDHLGSWHTITDENCNLLQELSFDPWGTRRNPATWRAFTGTPPEPLFDRGFNGHEHLYGFQLINMNGRMYDPLVSRMLSPDNFIQAPDFSQSFNRYSYCWNNPLVYTDPDGEIILPIFIGVMVGMYQGAMIASNSGMSFGGAMATIIAGGVIGGIAGGVGGVAGQATSAVIGGNIGFVGGAISGASGGFAGGFVGGSGNAWLGGADFGQGLNAGLVSGGYGALGGAMIGGITGGINAKRMGMDFWTGTGYGNPVDMSAAVAPPSDPGSPLGITGSQQLTEYTHTNYSGSEKYVQGVFDGIEGSSNPFARGGYVVKDNQLFNEVGDAVNGSTLPVKKSVFGAIKSLIIVSPNMITHVNNLHAVLRHEVIHAYHFYTGFLAIHGSDASEYYAHKFSASVPHVYQSGARMTYQAIGHGIPFSHYSVYPPWVPQF